MRARLNAAEGEAEKHGHLRDAHAAEEPAAEVGEDAF
jgi:hypothetical protein